MYLVFSHMLKSFDIEDLETLWKLVKAKHGSTRLDEGYKRVLWGDLKTMFDPHVEDQVWRNQQDYRVLDWKIYDLCGVYSLMMQHMHIYMLVEKRYPLTPATITDMLNNKLQCDCLSEMGRIVGIKRLHDDLEVTVAKIRHSHTEDNKEHRALGFYQRNNGDPSYQERRQTMEESLSKFMAESAKRHEENSNLIKEIRSSTDATIRNQGASIKALEIQIRKMSKVLQERGSRNFPSSTKTNIRDHVKSISTTVKAAMFPIRCIEPGQYAVSSPLNSKLFFEPRQVTIPFPSHLYDDCYDEEERSCELKNFDAYLIGTTLLDDALAPKEKYPRSFTLPCYINNLCFNKALADLGASVSVMDFLTYTNLELGELAPTKLIVELADRIVKRPKGIVENVPARIDKFVFPVDFIVLDMLEDLKTPLILGRPFLSTAHAKIDVFKRKITLRVGNVDPF
ncbi:zinc finger, CCHC-type containing protein [Tanacetum coccineum]